MLESLYLCELTRINIVVSSLSFSHIHKPLLNFMVKWCISLSSQGTEDTTCASFRTIFSPVTWHIAASATLDSRFPFFKCPGLSYTLSSPSIRVHTITLFCWNVRWKKVSPIVPYAQQFCIKSVLSSEDLLIEIKKYSGGI